VDNLQNQNIKWNFQERFELKRKQEATYRRYLKGFTMELIMLPAIN
jgi:hypothetical protein